MSIKKEFISLIENPNLISMEQNKFLETICSSHPFFSIAHILYAKGLLNSESILYNQKLKKAAIYSSDRKKLFKLITRSDVTNDIKKNKKYKKHKIKSKNPLDLKIGKPLKFTEKEERSFSEWMKLTEVKKIKRKPQQETELINKFLEKDPKISAINQEFFSPHKTAKSSLSENDDLVTETLARVYLEQKHFNKAIESYNKLILKYPKKSSFFADQIKLIRDLIKK